MCVIYMGLSYCTRAHLSQEKVLPNVAVSTDNVHVGLDHLQDPLPHGSKVWVYLSCEGNSRITLCILDRVLLHLTVHLRTQNVHVCTYVHYEV